MVSLVTSLLPAVVGAVLVWAGAFKLLGRRAAAVARRSALPTLVGEDRAVPVHRTVGCVEVVVGALLLLPPASAVDAALATVLCAGFVGFLGYSRVVAPESSCGCLSDKHTPVRWRAVARAGALTVASGVALFFGAGRFWGDAVASRPVSAGAVLLVAALVVAALSEDLDAYWLQPLRQLRVRLRHPLGHTAGATFEVPVESSVHQLLRSPAYQAAGAWVRSDLLDSWDEGDWRILNYAARYGDRQATAVFAVPRTSYEPSEVRAALVDETDQAVLWEHTPTPVPA